MKLTSPRYVLKTKDDKFVAIDVMSGGYPHFVDDIFRAEHWSKMGDAVKYMGNACWELLEINIVFKTVPNVKCDLIP